MKSFTPKFSIVFTLLVSLSGCHRDHTPVVVHVFRDRQGDIGKNIGTAIRAIASRPLTMSGKPIVIASTEFKDYRAALATLGATRHPDIIILNSGADLPDGDFGGRRAELNCAPRVTCVAVIPSWTSGETRNAAELVMTMIQNHISKP